VFGVDLLMDGFLTAAPSVLPPNYCWLCVLWWIVAKSSYIWQFWELLTGLTLSLFTGEIWFSFWRSSLHNRSRFGYITKAKLQGRSIRFHVFSLNFTGTCASFKEMCKLELSSDQYEAPWPFWLYITSPRSCPKKLLLAAVARPQAQVLPSSSSSPPFWRPHQLAKTSDGLSKLRLCAAPEFQPSTLVWTTAIQWTASFLFCLLFKQRKRYLSNKFLVVWCTWSPSKVHFFLFVRIINLKRFTFSKNEIHFYSHGSPN